MLGQEGYVEIHVMHRQGMSIKAISRELGVSRNTVRRYLRSRTVPELQARLAKPTKLDGYRRYLKSRVEAAHPDWIPATVLFAEIEALGYSGCVRSVSGYLATLKPKRKEDPLVRFETAPGRQMQVDWGAFRLNGRRVSLFLATLGWSRFNFGVFVENEQFETLRDCHERAFDAFGGVPLEVSVRQHAHGRSTAQRLRSRVAPISSRPARSGASLHVPAQALSAVSRQDQRQGGTQHWLCSA